METPSSPGSITIERHSRSQTIDKLAAALSKAQGQMANAGKDTEGNFGSYATLASTWDAIRKPLSDNEIAIYQRILTIDKKPVLCTMLLHSSGEFFDDCELELKFETNGRVSAMQAMGSAITYARRYCLQAVTGNAPQDDDDGAGAGNPDADKKPAAGKKTYSKPTPRPPSNEEPKIEIVPPGEYIMPLGSPAVVGKKLKDLDAETLQKVVTWSAGEIKANKKPENKAALIKINTNAQLVLNGLPRPSQPANETPAGGEVAVIPDSFEQQFPPDDVPPVMPPEPSKTASAEPRAKEWDYVLPIDFKGLGLKGQLLGELPEMSLYTISQDLEKLMRATPPAKNVTQLMEISRAIKAFFKTVKA